MHAGSAMLPAFLFTGAWSATYAVAGVGENCHGILLTRIAARKAPTWLATSAPDGIAFPVAHNQSVRSFHDFTGENEVGFAPLYF